MASPKVVLDTNVFLQAMMESSAAHAVLAACSDGRLKLVYSQKLMYEVEDKLHTSPRVAARVTDVAIAEVDEVVVNHGRCVADPRLRPSPVRIAEPNEGDDRVPNDPKDQFVYALAESTGALIITNDADFDHTDRLGIPRLNLYEAAAALRSPGGIQLALPDRNGRPQLVIS